MSVRSYNESKNLLPRCGTQNTKCSSYRNGSVRLRWPIGYPVLRQQEPQISSEIFTPKYINIHEESLLNPC